PCKRQNASDETLELESSSKFKGTSELGLVKYVRTRALVPISTLLYYSSIFDGSKVDRGNQVSGSGSIELG
ncbi:20312_t:CDS:2, partial [Gigaspora margarita]